MSEGERESVLQFVKEYYDDNEEVPSIAEICRSVDKIYREKFYSLFPGKLAEVCRASGLPIPEGRLESTKSATIAHEQPPESAKTESTRITLNETQSRRIFGISHLEGSKDPSLLLDAMIERDEVIRSMGLNLGQELDLYKNARVLMGNSPRTIADLLVLVFELKRRSWDIAEFMAELQKSTSLLSTTIRYLNKEISAKQALGVLMSE